MLPKITNKKIILALLLLIIVAAPFTNAVVLESGLPNTDLKPGTDISSLTMAQYINYIYIFVLGVIGIAVFASLVFWGVVWISSGIADKRGMALGKIKDAFTGLAIALGAYIILNTINPDLLKLSDLTLRPVTIATKKNLIGYTYAWKCIDQANRGDSFICSGTDPKCTQCGAKPQLNCGMSSILSCMKILPSFNFTSSPMAPSCTVGVQGENVTYQWAQLPLDQNGSKNCNDRLAGGGWSMVSDSFCTQPSPGVTYSCCGRCNQ